MALRKVLKPGSVVSLPRSMAKLDEGLGWTHVVGKAAQTVQRVCRAGAACVDDHLVVDGLGLGTVNGICGDG